MVTDDERREVAERLRYSWTNVPDKNPVRHQLRVLFEIYSAVGLADDDGADAIDLFDRLADLIEPSESGQNQDTNLDSVQKESPHVSKAHERDREAPETCEYWLDGECYARRTVRPVDRDALLALAKEMDRDGRIQRERQKYGGQWFIDGLDVMDYARRIREALGVIDNA